MSSNTGHALFPGCAAHARRAPASTSAKATPPDRCAAVPPDRPARIAQHRRIKRTGPSASPPMSSPIGGEGRFVIASQSDPEDKNRGWASRSADACPACASPATTAFHQRPRRLPRAIQAGHLESRRVLIRRRGHRAGSRALRQWPRSGDRRRQRRSEAHYRLHQCGRPLFSAAKPRASSIAAPSPTSASLTARVGEEEARFLAAWPIAFNARAKAAATLSEEERDAYRSTVSAETTPPTARGSRSATKRAPAQRRSPAAAPSPM
jgi:hypothetical protein